MLLGITRSERVRVLALDRVPHGGTDLCLERSEAEHKLGRLTVGTMRRQLSSGNSGSKYG